MSRLTFSLILLTASAASALIQKLEPKSEEDVGAFLPNKSCSDATADRRPWLVTFEQDGSPVPDCIGALVPVKGKEFDTDIVVTTSDCAPQNADPSKLAVIAGVNGTGETTNKQVSQAIRFFRPDSDPLKGPGPNIAIVVLETPITFNIPVIQPLCLVSPAKELDQIFGGLSENVDWIKNEAVLRTRTLECGKGSAANPNRPWLVNFERNSVKDTECSDSAALVPIQGNEVETDIVVTTRDCAKKVFNSIYRIVPFADEKQESRAEQPIYHENQGDRAAQEIAIVKLITPIQFSDTGAQALCFSSPGAQMDKIVNGLGDKVGWVKDKANVLSAVKK